MKLGIKALLESLFRRFGEDSMEESMEKSTNNTQTNRYEQDDITRLWQEFLYFVEATLSDANSMRSEFEEKNLEEKGLKINDVKNSKNFVNWLTSDTGSTEKLQNELVKDFKASKLGLEDYLNKFRDRKEIQDLVTDAIGYYIDFLAEQKRSQKGPDQIRLTKELLGHFSKILMEKFNQFFKEEYQNDEFFKGLNERLIESLRIEFLDMIEEDMNPLTNSTAYQQISQNIVGKDRKQYQELLNNVATKLFENDYKNRLRQRSREIISKLADPKEVENIINGNNLLNLQETFQKIAEQKINKEQDYFYVIGEDLYFTDLGKTTLLTLWRAHLKTNAESIINLFLAQIESAGAEQHKEVLEKENFKYQTSALSEDMQKLASVNERYKAFFGTQSMPLLEFLIERNLDQLPNVNKFDIEVPGYFGRDTTILHAMNRMTKRNLFYPMAPDLKSEKWTLTINPTLEYDKIASLYAGSLATEFRDILTVFAYRGALDENDPFHPLWVLIRNVMLAFDKYAFAHLEPGNLEKLVQTGGKVVDVTKQTLENVSSKNPIENPTENQPEAKPEQAASGAEQNIEPTGKTGIYSLHRLLKYAATESEIQELVRSFFRRFYGNAWEQKNPLNIDYVEYASDILPWKVIKLKIPYTFFRRIDMIKPARIVNILQGIGLKSYPKFGGNRYIVGYTALSDFVEGSQFNEVFIAVPNQEYKEKLKDILSQKYPDHEKEIKDIKDSDIGNWFRKVVEILGQPPDDLIKEIRVSPLLKAIINKTDFTKITDGELKKYITEITDKFDKAYIWEKLGLKPEEAISPMTDQARLQDLKYKLNQLVQVAQEDFFVTGHGSIQYNIFGSSKRNAPEVKLTREINTIIKQIQMQYGVTPDSPFPDKLIQELINMVNKLRDSFEQNNFGGSAFGLVQTAYNRVLHTAERIVLSVDDTVALKDIAKLYDSFAEFRSELLKVLETLHRERDRGPKSTGEDTPIARAVTSMYLDTAYIFMDKFVENPDISIMLDIGRLENILDYLRTTDPTRIAREKEKVKLKIEEIVTRLKLPKISNDKLEKLPNAEALVKMLQELATSSRVQEKLQQGEEGLIEVSKFPEDVEPDKYKLNVKFPKFGDRIKKVFDKFKNVFNTSKNVSQQTLVDDEQVYKNIVEMLAVASKNGVPVDILEESSPVMKRKISPTVSPGSSQVEEVIIQEKPTGIDSISFDTPEKLLDRIDRAIQTFQKQPDLVNELNPLKDKLLKLLKGAKNDNKEQTINEIKKIENEFKETLKTFLRSRGTSLDISSTYLSPIFGDEIPK